MTQISFEWLQIRNTKTNKIIQYAGMYVIGEIVGIKCYLQLDTGAAHTFIDRDFLEKNQLNKYYKSGTDAYYYGANKTHLKNVVIKLDCNKKITIGYCFIEKDLTAKERSHEQELLKQELPFAGYLGVDFFEGESFGINFKHQQIYFMENMQSLGFQSKFYISNGVIILPTIINQIKIAALFDTAMANTPLQLENKIFKSVTQKTIIDLPHHKVMRPDFSFKQYYTTQFVTLTLGTQTYQQKIQLETPEEMGNNFFFKHDKIAKEAILGNFLFRDKQITFDFTNNTYRIKN